MFFSERFFTRFHSFTARPFFNVEGKVGVHVLSWERNIPLEVFNVRGGR